MAQIPLKDADGTRALVEAPNANGRAAAVASRPVALSTEDKASIDAITAKLIAAPATAALQGDANAILTALGLYLDNVESLVTATNALLAAATPAGELHIGEVGGNSAVPTATFNRPGDTNAYASGDLVANSTTAGSVIPMSLSVARKNNGSGVIRRARLTTTKTGLAGTEVFRVHLFTAAPTVTNGDNGAFLAAGRAAGYLGFIDVTLSSVFSDGASGATAADIVFVTGGGGQLVYALLEARGAYTPASGETFALALESLRD